MASYSFDPSDILEMVKCLLGYGRQFGNGGSWGKPVALSVNVCVIDGLSVDVSVRFTPCLSFSILKV